MMYARGGIVPSATTSSADWTTIYINYETNGEQVSDKVKSALPRDDLFRMLPEKVEVRDADGGSMTLTGHFATFNDWTEIKSVFEGNFMERIAPGAFKKTFDEGRKEMRCLFQHGRDPQIGDKPLGPIESLSEDDIGAHYDVALLDTAYNRELIPGLREGLYGASFRFRVMREDVENDPERSDHNPDGIPERTIKEAQVYEFGPVTFPAYASATAGLRSLTDEFNFARLAQNPDRLRELVEFVNGREAVKNEEPVVAPREDAEPASPPTPTPRRKGDPEKGRGQYEFERRLGLLPKSKEGHSWA